MSETNETNQLKRTALYGRHVAAGATMVDFGGWEMPIQYPDGIVTEHLAYQKRLRAVRCEPHGQISHHGQGREGVFAACADQ